MVVCYLTTKGHFYHLTAMGDSNQSSADKMSPGSDEVSANHQSEEYDEPTIESDVEEESRGEVWTQEV